MIKNIIPFVLNLTSNHQSFYFYLLSCFGIALIVIITILQYNQFNILIKIIMFEQFATLHQTYTSRADNLVKSQIVEFLKRVEYFRNQASAYGADVLLLYLPFLQPYIIRESMELIKQKGVFVIMQGVLQIQFKKNEQRNKNHLGYQVLSDGMLLDTNKTQISSIRAVQDTSMIRLRTEEKKCQKSNALLKKFQSERILNARQFQRIVSKRKDINDYYSELRARQFFKTLGNYDFNELLLNSRINVKEKNSETHHHSQIVSRLYYIVEGTVKLSHTAHLTKKVANQTITQKYMIHKKKRKSIVVSYLEKNECLGLYEYLMSSNYESVGQIVSHEAILLEIPIEMFVKKFNDLTNAGVFNKMKRVIENKKALFEKTLSSKKKKQDQMEYEKQRLEILSQRKGAVNMTIDYHFNHKQSIPKKNSKRFSGKNNKSQMLHPHQCYMPDRIDHKLQVFKQKYSYLPKIKQKITLFPEQYEKANIPLELRQKMKLAEASLNYQNKQQPPQKNGLKSHRSTQLSPQAVRNKYLFENIKLQMHIGPQYNTSKQLDSEPQNPESPRSINNILSFRPAINLEENDVKQCITTKYHHNQSIYNNFRVNRSKDSRFLEKLQKTLYIN